MSVARDLSCAICCLGNFAWELPIGAVLLGHILRLGHVRLDISFGNFRSRPFALKQWLGPRRVGPFTWSIRLGILRLTYSVWYVSFGGFRLRCFVWERSLENFHLVNFPGVLHLGIIYLQRSRGSFSLGVLVWQLWLRNCCSDVWFRELRLVRLA